MSLTYVVRPWQMHMSETERCTIRTDTVIYDDRELQILAVTHRVRVKRARYIQHAHNFLNISSWLKMT